MPDVGDVYCNILVMMISVSGCVLFDFVLCKWTNILSDASNTAVSSGAALEVYVN